MSLLATNWPHLPDQLSHSQVLGPKVGPNRGKELGPLKAK